ncbi:MAG: type II toxin-antitoxin system Phd/YefM family antitoxin [Geminicoccaceae bacterium]|nr:type II toxin-antitoxin system Phd/YefM family antitoxin [Geminicoccaceae bacterium]
MTTVNLDEAGVGLADLLARVRGGEEIVLAADGVPVARLVPVTAAPTGRRFGSARGLIEVGDDFDDPLPEDLLRAFGARGP